MPHLKSAAKHLRQSRNRAKENKKIKEQLKNLLKNAKSEKDLPVLYKAIDKAAKRRIIHANKAARMKSALSKKLTTQNSTN